MSFWSTIDPVAGVAEGNNNNTFWNLVTGGAWGQQDAQSAQNSANIFLAQQNREWSEKMSNSAYQRAMADMRAAGLNPMLAFSQGGAGTPSSGPAQVGIEDGNSQIGTKLGARFGEALGLTSALKKQSAETDLTRKNVDVADTTMKLNDANSEKATWSARADEERTWNMAKERQLMTKKAKIMDEQHRDAKASADRSEMERDLQKSRFDVDNKLQPADAVLERIEQAAGAITSGRGAFKSSKSRTRSYDVNPGTGEVYRERHVDRD